MKGTVTYTTVENLALLTIDNAPVNALSSGVRQGLFDGMEQALSDDTVKAIVVTGAGKSFIAGADISEFSGKMEGAPLHLVLAKMEASTKPVIAALNGTAFGGGLETALCCDYRVIAPGAQVGLPEVKLGLLPGAGGTQRLPRLISVSDALQIMLTGEPVGEVAAVKFGIADKVLTPTTDQSFLELAMAFAKSVVAEGATLRKIRDLDAPLIAARADQAVFPEARRLAAKIARGQDAPNWIIDSVEAAVNGGDFDQGLQAEAKNFMKCFRSPQRKALIHVFFNERTAAKIPFISKETPKKKIKSAAVIGAGTMGGGIAMCFANAGIPVKVLDVAEEGVQKGLAVIQKNYQKSVKRGSLSPERSEERLGLISGTTDYQSLQDVDIVVEAVFENMAIKKEVFATLDKVAKPDAILATNTSALDIDEIASATQRPQSVVGLHFFSPANVMKLLEVVNGKETSDETLATAMALGKKLKKAAVLAGNCRGFIGNRMLFQYMQQANQLLLEGALPEQVDQALYEFGFKMGPFAMMDLVGLDLGWRERKRSGRFPEITKIADALCETGRLGQKNGLGYYRYEESSRQAQPDPIVTKIVGDVVAELGNTKREFTNEEIVKRCIYPLINEGAKILEEGMALRASDIDIAYIYGYGFPAWRGGPMFYADAIGLENILADLKGFQEQGGDFWKPAALLEALVEKGESFKKYVKA